MNETEALRRFARAVEAAADELTRHLDEAPRGDRWDAIAPPLGPMQRRILAMDSIETQRGVSAADVLKTMNGRAGPQTGQALETLERRGLLERVANSSPARYRLTPAYRTAGPLRHLDGARAAMHGG